MNFEKLHETNFKVSKVEEWKHRIQTGLTTVTLNLETARPGTDKKDGKPNTIIDTTNHYSELVAKRGLTQPIKSYVQIRRQISSQIIGHIKEIYSNIQPKKIHLLLWRKGSGKRTYYRSLCTTNEDTLKEAIVRIKARKVQRLYALFKDDKKLKGEWLKI